MNLKSLVGTALFIAMGLILPTIFHMISAGNVLLPMHIPVILCGFCFGPIYGLICGMITPLISSIVSGMPVLFPTGILMVVELGCYGFFSGLFYQRCKLNIYIALILTMLIGRVTNALATFALYHLFNIEFSLTTFLTASFVTAFPGIILQLIAIPIIIAVLTKAKLIENPRVERT